MEKLRDVRAFVSECLVCQTHVFFFSVLGKVYTDDDMSLALLGLVSTHLYVAGEVCSVLIKEVSLFQE